LAATKATGDRITAFITHVATVAAHVLPANGRRVEGIEFLPEILIQHWFLGSGLPAALLPVMDPLRNPFENILTIGIEGDRPLLVELPPQLQGFNGRL